MSYLVALLRPRRPSWPTLLVLVGVAMLGLSLVISSAQVGLLAVSTVGALAGGAAFVLGVSASISAFFEREAYADSDFYR